MTPDFSPELARELLDDFYAECDEQLGVLRNLLSELEGGEHATPAASVFEPLFRTMHSLKGNAAIVGLREAEDLAHAAEGFLKLVMQGRARLSGNGADALLRTVHRLEAIIAAHRQKAPLSAAEDLIADLKRLAATDTAEPGEAVADTSESRPAYRFTFSPSRELDERGININAIRDALAATGVIADSRPVIGNGSMQFEFLVTPSTPPDPAEWRERGVTIERIAPPPFASSEGAAQPAAPEQGASLFIAPSHVVRVDIGRLDELLRIAGELVIQRSRLDDRLNHEAPDIEALKEVNQSLARSLRDLREAITRVRLVPVAEVFARLPFVVRDLARGSAKKARVAIEGKHTEIDKYIVERLKEPLLHLVRNAFTHGIESPEERAAAGKPAEGVITLSAAAEGGFIVIKIRDDGAGVNTSRILRRARAMKLPVPETVDDKAVLDLLCAPGFSTREQTDLAAGRGVGMSVVRNVVQELGGTLSLQSEPGRGARFTLRLPLTLSILDTLLLSVSGQVCALPQHLVQEIVEVRDDAFRFIKTTEVVPYREGVLPVVRLGKLFGPSAGAVRPARFVLVIRTEDGFAGLVADRVIGRREVVVRPMDDPLIQAHGIAGATELGDGRPVLILDALALLDGAVRPSLEARPAAPSDLSQS